MVSDRHVARRRVLLDRCERRKRREEIIVGGVVVGERDFACDRRAALGPERVGDERLGNRGKSEIESEIGDEIGAKSVVQIGEIVKSETGDT